MAQAKIRIEDQNSLQAEPLERGAPSAGLDLGPFRRALAIAASGLTLAEGAARLDREAGRVEAMRADRRQRRLDRHRVMTLNDGQAPAALTKDQAKALGDADDIERAARTVLLMERGSTSAGDRKAARGKLGEAYALRAGVERDRAVALAGRQDDLRLIEAATLDALREEGEPGALVERRRGQTLVRLVTRDGLKLLHERGAFTPRDGDGVVRRDQAARIEADRLLAIGLRYRDKYEMAQADLRSCLGDAGGARVERHFWAQGAVAHSRAAKARSLRKWEGLVSVNLGADALLALRMVAGEARTINSITTARRRRGRLADGLRAALGVIADRVEKDR